MKAAILAGGMGTRLAEETEVRPKPMVEIGGRPIIWHIMRYYAHYGVDDFVVALGYKGDHIRRYFADYHSSVKNMRVNLGDGSMHVYGSEPQENWTVDLVETGRWTNTGGRIKRLAAQVGDEPFFLTWGDGVSNVDLDALVKFHRSHGRLLTVTAVHPPPRFGQLVIDGDRVVDFSEKPIDTGWINGAFFVAEPGILDYIDGDETQFEKEPMENLAADGELMAYQHDGFWQCMDTMRDKVLLERLWDADAPWRVWEHD